MRPPMMGLRSKSVIEGGPPGSRRPASAMVKAAVEPVIPLPIMAMRRGFRCANLVPMSM